MRRLALLVIGGAAFLLLGALPVLADGGPHVSTLNSGTLGISSDSCAGCHRTHTSEAPLLLANEEPGLCLTCHGGPGAGATTDVMNGIQYNVTGQGTDTVLGALRGGGFGLARIDTANAGRSTYTRRSGSGTAASPYEYPTTQSAVVPVMESGVPVTSTHMDVNDPDLVTVWGNGPISASGDPGGSMTLTCTNCHNPHGNGMYRSLRPIPVAHDGTVTMPTTEVAIPDAPLPVDDVRNYTVIQKLSTTATFGSTGTPTADGDPSGYLLYAKQIAGVYAPDVGDYFHRVVPWMGRTDYTAQKADPTAPATVTQRMMDAPNGKPTTFDGQINAWCSQCHTRYLATTGAPYEEPLQTADTPPVVDSIFTYRHSNTRDKPCTTCHVAHGSNAAMTGLAATAEWPGDPASMAGGSRLLKIDNRGTCQACHDPTDTVPAGTYVGPVPSPVVP